MFNFIHFIRMNAVTAPVVTSMFFRVICFSVSPSRLWFIVSAASLTCASGSASHLLLINSSTSVEEPRSSLQSSPDYSVHYSGSNIGRSQFLVLWIPSAPTNPFSLLLQNLRRLNSSLTHFDQTCHLPISGFLGSARSPPPCQPA